MPYKDLKSANAAILAIVPPVDLEQANLIASIADGIAAGNAPPEPGKEWPIAISQFKKSHEAKGDVWVKKAGAAEADPETSDMPAPPVIAAPVAAPPEPALKPTPDSIRLEMLPIAKFDPVTLELVDVDPTQGIQALVGMSAKWADGDPLVVQQYVFTGDAWNDQSAAKWAKAKGAKKGEPWDAKPASETPPPPDEAQAERHYNQPRKHARTLAEIKHLRKRVELLLKEIDGQADMPILPGDEPPAEGDKVAALQAAFDDFCASIADILGLPGGAPITDGMGMGERLTESFGGDVMRLALEDAPLAEGSDPASKPLSMLVELIQPGWGNVQDNHYYPADMLKTCSGQFVGKKMYESDHRPEQKSTRTWVSTITEIKGFSAGGAPVARVVVHDPGFAERIRNLGAAGLLDKMECSILADGKASVGFEENGRRGKRVDAITSVESVDWVTRAGAGGHAAELAETKGGANMSNTLTAAVSQSLVAASKLPEAARVRLAEGTYPDEASLKAAIDREREYVKTLTGSGQPFGNAPAAATPALTEADRLKAQDAVINRYMR